MLEITENTSEPARPITIYDLAVYRIKKAGGTPGDSLTGEDFQNVYLAIWGGCYDCESSIAAYNAYPSKNGYWRCADCIGDQGWTDVEVADREITR